MEEEHELSQDMGENEDTSTLGSKVKSPTATASQASIDLDVQHSVKSDFFMQDDKDNQAATDNIHAMFSKPQGSTSDIEKGGRVPSNVSFLEGEETEGFFGDEYEYGEEFEDLEAEYDEWGQGVDVQDDIVSRETIKPPRERAKKRSDFGMMPDTSGIFDVKKMESFGTVVSAVECISSVSEEEVKEEVEEEEKPIDREPYYELYKSLLLEYPMAKMKNNFLQRKMAEYFKKRKMEHVLREADRIGDAEQKYFSKLDALSDLKCTNDMQRNALSTELNEMKELRDKQYNTVITNFEAMLAREKEIGTGLIFTKTAKEIPEKFLERLIKNQRLKSNEITDMRLRYIKLRNSIEEITAAIRAMDKIGENHTLIDYEQLKMENQNYSDKIEEREEELSKLREKCSGAIQILAHLREKSAAMDLDILDLAENLEEAVLEKNEFRERVGQLKHERDTLRTNIVKLQEESGLLTKQKLLLDMEDTLDQIANIKKEVERIEKTYRDNAKALDIIKHNIKVEREAFHNRAYKVEDQRKRSKTLKTYKEKPKFGNIVLEKFNIEL